MQPDVSYYIMVSSNRERNPVIRVWLEIMNTEVEKFADYLIEWIVSKCDIEFDRKTEFNIVRMIVDCVEMYEKEEIKNDKQYFRNSNF